jgi:hypothetical protein
MQVHIFSRWRLRAYLASTPPVLFLLRPGDVAAQLPQENAAVRALRSSLARVSGEVGALRAGESSHSAEYFFNAVTIIVAVAAGLIATAAIIATVVGYRMVRSYVASEFATRAESAFDEHGKPHIEAAIKDAEGRLTTKLDEVDTKLAAEIDQFRHASDQTQ